MQSARTFAFGPFLLVPERQLLMRDGAPVRIGGRALDLLTALVERAGELVSKVELTARAWPTTFVEEANLKVNMGLLRRVLDDTAQPEGYIATVIGRGYRFVAPVKLVIGPPGQKGSRHASVGPAPAISAPCADQQTRGDPAVPEIREVRLLSIRTRTVAGETTLSVQLAEAIISDAAGGNARGGGQAARETPDLGRVFALSGLCADEGPGILTALHDLLDNPAMHGGLPRPAQLGGAGATGENRIVQSGG